MGVRLKYSTSKNNTEAVGYVIAEEYDEFFVISKVAYNRAKRISHSKKPNFLSDKEVYISGVTIS